MYLLREASRTNLFDATESRRAAIEAWPNHSDGRPMKLGEMTRAQRRAIIKRSIARLNAGEFDGNVEAEGGLYDNYQASEDAYAPDPEGDKIDARRNERCGK